MCIVRYIVREENEKRLSKQKKKRARDKCYTCYSIIKMSVIIQNMSVNGPLIHNSLLKLLF